MYGIVCVWVCVLSVDVAITVASCMRRCSLMQRGRRCGDAGVWCCAGVCLDGLRHTKLLGQIQIFVNPRLTEPGILASQSGSTMRVVRLNKQLSLCCTCDFDNVCTYLAFGELYRTVLDICHTKRMSGWAVAHSGAASVLLCGSWSMLPSNRCSVSAAKSKLSGRDACQLQREYRHIESGVR